jgi:hypothetical protein
MATPQARAEAKKGGEKEKKRGGLWGDLLGGSAGSGGAGGFGGVLGKLAAFLPEGMLATKTGLLALLLVGATVAGGIGTALYSLLGSDSAPASRDVQLFAQKPKENGSPEVPPVPEDGSSQSLKFLSQGNAAPGEAGGASGALKDATAANGAGAAGAGAGDMGAGTGAAGVAAATGDGVNKNLLKAPKIGELTGPGAYAPGKGAAGGRAATGGSAGTGSAGVDPTARAGSLSGMKKGLSALAGGSNSHGRGFGSNGAAAQAFGAMHDNRNATTSAAGGTTYDGSAPTGNNAGGNGTQIGPASPAAADAAQPTSLPAAQAANSEVSPPPTPTATAEAPWQNAIHTAQMMIALAVALMVVAKLLSKTGPGHIIAMVVAAVVASLGAMIIALGAQVAGGQYGQKLQGGVLAAAGMGLMVMAAATAFGGKGDDTSLGGGDTDGLNTDGYTSDETAPSDSSGLFGDVNPLVLIGGGAALVGLAGSMMVPLKQYPSSDFQNGNPPDTHWFGYREAPSETALKKMVA